MKQKFIYSRTNGTYSRIVDETESTYHITDDMGYVYIEDKDKYEDDPFWLEIMPKGSLVRHRFRNILVTVDNVDIDDYYHMYHVSGDDVNLWVGSDNIEPVNY
mgnify:CR=1 FL=1